MTKFPEVQAGGSLILAWQIRNKHVLVIGGGEVCIAYRTDRQYLLTPTSGRRWTNSQMPRRRCQRHSNMPGRRPERRSRLPR